MASLFDFKLKLTFHDEIFVKFNLLKFALGYYYSFNFKYIFLFLYIIFCTLKDVIGNWCLRILVLDFYKTFMIYDPF